MASDPCPPCDYAAWLGGLRGAPLAANGADGADGADADADVRALGALAADGTLDYVSQTKLATFLVHNFALLQRDPQDATGDRLFYDFELPRGNDVVADLKSVDPRVALTVRINSMTLEPQNSFLVAAAPYNCVHARMTFSLEDVRRGLEDVGFTYTALDFQHAHRVRLASGNLFAGPVLYANGVARRL